MDAVTYLLAITRQFPVLKNLVNGHERVPIKGRPLQVVYQVVVE
jgi:hypothetical protein